MKGKNKKGFTLIEMIAVIAIIGVIAAILVPTMMNYIKKAKLKSANFNAKILYNEMNGAITDIQNNNLGNINDCTAAVDCSADDPSDLLRHTIYSAMKNNSSDEMGYAYWTTGTNGSGIKLMQWCKNENPSTGDIIGQYPDPANDISELPASFIWGTKF